MRFKQNCSAKFGDAGFKTPGRGEAVEAVTALTPEERVELLQQLIQMGVPVYTYYRRRRVVEIRQEGSWVVLRFDNGEERKIHVTGHFARIKFVAVV